LIFVTDVQGVATQQQKEVGNQVKAIPAEIQISLVEGINKVKNNDKNKWNYRKNISN